MSRPVSILVWRDAKTDPPTGDMHRLVLVRTTGGQTLQSRAHHIGPFSRDAYRNAPALQPRYWAEVPIVSDLTDDDVRNAASDSDYVADLWKRHGLPRAETRARADRLRAALGGEKEET